MISIFRLHWQGDSPILTAFFGLGLLGSMLLIGAGRLVLIITHELRFSVAIDSSIGLLWLTFCFLVWLWAVVGIWRSAERVAPASKWGARSILILSALFLAPAAIGSGSAAKELMQLARGRDEMGPPAQLRTNGASLRLSGALATGSATAFAAILKSGDFNTLLLDSPGGRIAEALQISALVRQNKLNTVAIDECESACTIILISGKQRGAWPGAKIGFHQSTFPGNRFSDDNLQTEQVRDYFRSSGISEEFIKTAFATTSNNMWFPTEDEMIKANIINQDSMDLQLRSAIAEISKRLPLRIDAMTTLRTADVYGNKLIYKYSLNLTKKDSQFFMPSSAMKDMLRHQACSDNFMKHLIDNHSEIIYKYTNSEGGQFATFVIRSCNKVEGARP